MQLVGVDGNFLSFTFGCAAIMNTDSDTFLWVMEQCVAAYGANACAAVHWVLGDEDPGQNAAFEEAKNKVCILTVIPIFVQPLYVPGTWHSPRFKLS